MGTAARSGIERINAITRSMLMRHVPDGTQQDHKDDEKMLFLAEGNLQADPCEKCSLNDIHSSGNGRASLQPLAHFPCENAD